MSGRTEPSLPIACPDSKSPPLNARDVWAVGAPSVEERLQGLGGGLRVLRHLQRRVQGIAALRVLSAPGDPGGGFRVVGTTPSGHRGEVVPQQRGVLPT